MRALIVACLCIISLVLVSNAVTIYVPEDYLTIQEAVDAAIEGDTVFVAPGEYAGLYITEGPDDITLLGSGAFVAEPTIVHSNVIGYFGSCIEINNVSGWEIGHFTLDQDDPNEGSAFDFYFGDDCWIHHLDIMNVAPSSGNGLCVSGMSNTIIERCLVRAGEYDVVSAWYDSNSNLTIRNLTVNGNSNGIINRSLTPNWQIQNCLVYDNGDEGIEINYWDPTYDIEYNNSWGNSGSNYSGFSPSATNISEDPLLFGGTGWEAYMLLPGSPCIDAGDPTSPPDPDGTVADIGCFYFDQNFTPGNLTVDIEPVNPPITIPPEGGYFDYDLLIECDSSNYAIFDGWIEFVLPDGQIMTPVLLRMGLFIAANGEIDRDMEFWISQWAMPGIYEVWCKVGDYPDEAWASDMFEFEKLPTDGYAENVSAHATISGWGEPETVELPVGDNAIPSMLKLSAAPNPFNPQTTLSFSLPAADLTSVTIYDLQGRTVATLLDRQMEAGYHSVQFEASHLSSGMYLAVVESGQHRTVQRLLMVK